MSIWIMRLSAEIAAVDPERPVGEFRDLWVKRVQVLEAVVDAARRLYFMDQPGSRALLAALMDVDMPGRPLVPKDIAEYQRILERRISETLKQAIG